MSNVMMNIRKWSRFIHRDLSYFLSGMVLVYAISGIAMNHRDSFNPDYSVEQISFQLPANFPVQSDITKEDVLHLLQNYDEQDNYTKHYFPKTGVMKVFLKGGSNMNVDLGTRQAVYEKLTRRPLLSSLTRLHYNPGHWWTTFADIFAVGLIVLTLTGIVMVKGPKGLLGRGGVELLIGIAIPVLFLFL